VGPVPAEELGITLPHEHLLCDARKSFIPPATASDLAMAYKPVSMEILHWLRYHPFSNIDNCQLMDEQEAVEEIMTFKKAGGKTVVDVSDVGLGRDPAGLARISRATGLHIIMGSGYYVAPSLPEDMSSKKEEEITEEIVRDITEGVGNTGIRSGLIGEIGCSWPLHEHERKSLRAAARAQKRTGAPLNFHPGRNSGSPFEVIDLLEKAGADLSRAVISHTDCRVRDHEKRRRLAEKGCFLEYDTFGWEGQFPVELYYTPDVFYQPNDTQRIFEIMQLINEGFLSQILISQDIFIKTWRARYGGKGYGHVINDVVPRMLYAGITREQIETIMIENPKRLLCFLR